MYMDMKKYVGFGFFFFFCACMNKMLERFLPPFCAQHVVVSVDEELGKFNEKDMSTRRLELSWWLAAYDRYTLAAVAMDQVRVQVYIRVHACWFDGLSFCRCHFKRPRTTKPMS